MNDMMPTIEETATPADLAQIEHQKWERDNEEHKRWEAIEAIYNEGEPLFTQREWSQHCVHYNEYVDWVGSVHADSYTTP
tara:strand:+ start:5951 stop:6190 length:240 start_codon:yes stop_codon:yes gene_type:complete